MRETEQRREGEQFAREWKGRGYEKGECQPFWLSLLRRVYGVEEPENYIVFEEQVHLDHTSFIDGFIPATHVLIEQKGLGKDLKRPIRQSDGSLLTPFQQAKRYAAELPYSKRPRWIVISNFEEFHIYDMEWPGGDPEIVRLENLGTEFYRLQFLTDTGDSQIKKEMEISLQAGEVVGALYEEILKQYKEPEAVETLKSLNILCVRLVFCLYAEDAGIFGGHGKFHNYLKKVADKDLDDVREALLELFRVLDTKPEDRDPYMKEELASFPYVNGGLFAEENLLIPRFNQEIVHLLLKKASEDFDWSAISPTIFGAVFESTLNPATRRMGGMHYTSIENIHKVIEPLFLEDLRKELEEIKAFKGERVRERRLREFQKKLGSMKFLDPACGSGNFLTETYISLRRMENEVLQILNQGQLLLGNVEGFQPIQVSIGQFYGIELNDFAVTVAKTALWIAESQMMKETEDIVHMSLDFLPLKSYANIIEGNALRLSWEETAAKEEIDYIMGNPPFVGAQVMNREQKKDILEIFGKDKKAGNLDYVSGWYLKALSMMEGTKIRGAFVSTNSISQGEQASLLWKQMFQKGAHIDFAYRTFRWDSEAKNKAKVHCVIIGFSTALNRKPRRIYTKDRWQEAENINAYLQNGENIFIERRQKPLWDAPQMYQGNQAIDGGHLILSREEKEELLKAEPQAEGLLRPYMMGKDFILRRPRYCLWLEGVSPALIAKCPRVKKRIEQVREYRLLSSRTATRQKAQTPALFADVRDCKGDYVAIPKVSSENRRYIPMDYLPGEIIPGDKVFVLQEASLYHFGVLTSNVHMAWVRAFAGRLKSDYSYSNMIVYNNFPWPSPREQERARIEETAGKILEARSLYPDSSLADLYHELLMPPELRRAHQENDRAVMRAYGFSVKDMTEEDCVGELMKLYEKKSAKEERA